MRHLSEVDITGKHSNEELLSGVMSCLLATPVSREIIRNMVQELVAEEVAQNKIINELREMPKMKEGKSQTPHKPKQISTREAAEILGYHPRYLCRHATKWGLTKVYMSSRSCRFLLDEIYALIEERGWTEKQ